MHKKHVRFKRDLNRRKRAAQNSVERRVDREGWGKAEIQSEHLPLSKKHSQGKQSACFSAEEEKRLQGGWVRRGRRRSSEKRDEQRTVRASLRTEKRRQRALNAALRFWTPQKNSAPPPPEASAQLRCKSSKRQREHFCFCAWFFGTAVGYR